MGGCIYTEESCRRSEIGMSGILATWIGYIEVSWLLELAYSLKTGQINEYRGILAILKLAYSCGGVMLEGEESCRRSGIVVLR